MIPPRSFERTLAAYDPGLFVRWEHYRPSPYTGTATCLPMIGEVVERRPEEFPSEGRFVIRHKDRLGRVYKLFDVVYSDATPHPLDRRVLEAVRRRDDAWDEVLRERPQENPKAPPLPAEHEEMLDDALSAFYRAHTGHRPLAMGAPGAPAAPAIGSFANEIMPGERRSSPTDPAVREAFHNVSEQ